MHLRRLLSLVIATTFTTIATARASTIDWQLDLLVHGTFFAPAPPGSPPVTPGTLVVVPVGTPMTIDMSFDTGTPNQCGPDAQFGTYLLGAGEPGPPSSVTLDFLGYSYSASVGVEIGTQLGSCISAAPSIHSVYRFFVGAGVQTDPGGMVVNWGGSLPGTAIFFGPDAATLGGLPTTLPSDPFRMGGFFPPTITTDLSVDFSQVRTVPEPSSAGLLLLGALVAVVRRRCRRIA